MFTEPERSAEGHYIIDWKNNYPHWRAWQEWLREECKKNYPIQKLALPLAWPPETPNALSIYMTHMDQVFEACKRDKFTPRPLPVDIKCWRGWSPEMKRDVIQCEAQRRKDWDSSYHTAPHYAIRHRIGFRHEPPMNSDSPKLSRYRHMFDQNQAAECAA